MGLITTPITLRNPREPALAAFEGEALVDTGTIDLCLPAEVADNLRLEVLERRTVVKADGQSHVVPYVGPVQVNWNGRGCYVGALVLGHQVLLGALPMEDMNLIVYPAERVVRVSPNPQVV